MNTTATLSARQTHCPDQVADPRQDELVLCPHCDLLQYLPVLAAGEQAHCLRCQHQLDARQPNPILRPALYAASALLMLLLANLFPFVSMALAGNRSEIHFFDTSAVLFTEYQQVLAILIWLFIQAVPAFCMLAIIYLKLGMRYHLPARIWVARVLFMLKPWSMVDIFLMGLLISFVKLVATAEISLGMSFWAFCLFCLLHLRTFQVLDRHALWASIAPSPQPDTEVTAGSTGLDQQLKLCHCCTAVVPLRQRHCSRCHTKVTARLPASIQKTLALLITACVLYIPANMLPIMRTVSFGDVTDSTIISGFFMMWQDGEYPVAIIIFLASVVIPIIKIVLMFWLCYLAAKPRHAGAKHSGNIYRLVDWVGRWSMVDVLVVAFMAALVRFGLLASVYPGIGALVFAAVVITTMLAAVSFDPRLLWDNQQPAAKAVQYRQAEGKIK
ncbi:MULTISPECIES: PqiA/YebS family transporter subunit [unclassified Arsukibacterium]|uniref:PqiA/YebS family transporter subunit n=1 Tax=unclassified Arsukibacterium TaxID=2635278 RepID=UPI000E863919|nr:MULTISPECIES: PqiA/YebS family transporter subunit [unclassified Arsukibacterium]HAW92600.1 paraquat-inducible membrane protein A [Candidatus Azambacteria bacterium]